jgi:hypothetical protein
MRHETNDSVCDCKNKQNFSICSNCQNIFLVMDNTVWMDNFYNSPRLTHFMKLIKTHCVGTSCDNSKHLPPVVKDKTLKKEEHCGQHSKDVALLALQYKK